MKRSAQGSIAKRNGKAFESRLESYFTYQNNLGNCDIRKQNEALKPVRSLGKGMFCAVYQTQSGCDYFGTFMGGYSIVIEAKHRESDRIRMSDFTEAEVKHLQKTAVLGGYAVVIVEFSDGKMYLLPFLMIEHSDLLFKYKHIKETDLNELGFSFNFSSHLIDVVTKNVRKGLSMIIDKRNAKNGNKRN